MVIRAEDLVYTVWQVGRDIQSGKIVLDLVKPMDYRRYIFWSFSGAFVTNFFCTFLPTFIVVAIVTNGAIHMGLNLLYFAVSVVLAIMVNFSIDFIVATICLYTESIWGINMMKQVIVLLLSGATVPLAFFPDTLRNIVDHLPFQAIYNAPLTLLLDGDPDMKDVCITLGTQLAWCVGMFIVSKLFWKHSIKQITVNGG